MAKYSYSYACGHGTGSVSLSAKVPTANANWLGTSKTWFARMLQKQQAAADEAAEQVAVIITAWARCRCFPWWYTAEPWQIKNP